MMSCLDCLFTPEEVAQRIKNTEIDKQIVIDRKTYRKIVKNLVLGMDDFSCFIQGDLGQTPTTAFTAVNFKNCLRND